MPMKNIENKINVNHTLAMFEDYPDMLNVAELQKALHIGRNSVYRLIESNKIKTIRMGKIIRIPKPYLIDYVLGGQQ